MGYKNTIKKILLIFPVFIFMLLFMTVNAQAANKCGGSACGCNFKDTCKGKTCWYNPDGTDGCRGHSWTAGTLIGSSSQEYGTRTCTTGSTTVTVYTFQHVCTVSGCAGKKISTSTYTANNPPLGHLDTDLWHNVGNLHTKYCNRCGVLLHAEGHNWGAWTYNENGYHYRYCVNRSACNASQSETYSFTAYFNANGGTLVGNSSKAMQGGSSTYNLGSYATRTGYSFMGWGTNSSWCDTRYSWNSNYKTASGWAGVLGKSIQYGNNSGTLYAQWERTITYTFRYFNNQASTVSATFHNEDSSKTVTIPENTRWSNKTYGGHSDWSFRGFSGGTAWNSGISIDSGTSQITINSTNADTTYYAQYQRTVTIKYVDYGDNRQCTNTQQSTAYLNYDGNSVYSPTFTSRTENAMYYTERGVISNKKEGWSSSGWTTSADERVSPTLSQNTNFSTYKDTTYYGLYQKGVKLTYNYNGSYGGRYSDYYTRYANASNVANATVQNFSMPKATYTQNGVIKYCLGAWTGIQVIANRDFNVSTIGLHTNIVGDNVGDEHEADFTYTPRVSDTVYAAWTNQTAQTAIEPKVNVVKSVEWETPSSDNSSVDYDGLQNIDKDGNAVVTLDITVENTNGYNVSDFKVDDYINTDMWTYKYDVRDMLGGVTYVNYKNGSIHIELPSTKSSATYQVKYTLQLKEPYWNVTEDTNLYINKIPDVNKYLNSLTNKDAYSKYDSTKNYNSVAGIVNYSNMYYCENQAAEQSYVKATYNIKNGLLQGTQRQVHYATPYVVMRQVNWIPTTHQVGIESDTNNIYHNIDSSYKNTYFVRYDTKGANSTFRLYELSQLDKSYTTYQITNNIMDMQSVNKTQEVIDNALGVGTMRNSSWSNTTSSKLSSGFKALDLLKVSKADNIRSSVNTAGVIYPYGALTSYDTNYATNQDGLKLSIYPFVRTTNSKTGKTYETTRDTSKLANDRLDLTIDATDPIITADSNIKTKSDAYGNWTESDGYIDINLVNKSTNPTAATKELTFKFEDKVSGVNSPYATSEDWINTSRDNVQVTLKRVDNEPITIFDSNATTSNDNKYVKVTYDSTNTMNKTGNVKVTLDPTDRNILGHLKLTIRVYDNVGNWTEKTYDLYVFCLTGAVEISDTLPSYLTRQYSLNQFANGEMGVVKVSAGGYADRVTVSFGDYLDKLYKDEYGKRQNFANDKVTTINGDYPNTDAKDVSGTNQNSSMTYLPYEWQVNTWGYTNDTLGGVRLQNVETNKNVKTVNNSILKEHLNDLIKRYQDIKQGKQCTSEYGDNYAIIGSTLYTYPAINGNSISSYVDKYELGGETYYNDAVYPEYITLDGTKGISIVYDTIDGDSTKMAASIEATTEISVSNWTAVGNSYLRPFIHYFYMPLEANKKTASAPYYVTLTEYKDSEKAFKHSVSVRLSFTNDDAANGAISKKIETYIKDN